MADYSQSIDFSDKDALASGQAAKVAKGADIDTELALIATSLASKTDESREGAASGIATLDGSTLVPVAQLPSSTTTAEGIIETGTDAEATTGTATDKVVTPANLQAVLDQNAGVAEQATALTDPGADRILMWDDSSTGTELAYLTANTALTITGTNLDLDHLGFEDLVDPDADRIAYWDDSAGKFDWLVPGNGLEINLLNFQITDSAATTTNPCEFVSGKPEIDLFALTTIQGNALAVTDTFLVDDAGTPKGLAYKDMGLIINLSQSTQTLALAAANTIMEFNGTATLTIPLNSSVAMPIGSAIILVVDHASQVLTVTAATSVTLNSVFHAGGVSAASDTVNAGGTAVLIKTEADEWYLSGDIST